MIEVWRPEDELMHYSELRIRDVLKDPDTLNSYIGFYYSEKLDGWHAVWDGKGQLYTKSGKKKFKPPESFLKFFPQGVALSGELVVRRSQATDVASLLKADGPWEKARFYAFDLPADRTNNFELRTRRLKTIVSAQCNGTTKCPLRFIEQKKLASPLSFLDDFGAITECSGNYHRDGSCYGEGVVLTNPKSLYTPGRARKDVRVKLKRRQDDEATVIGYSSNRHSLTVKFAGVQFQLGVGFTNEQRSELMKHFPVGSLVKFSFRSLGKNGVPKEARFVGSRHISDVVRTRPVRGGSATRPPAA
jgi:ATP-dependent DNA ligase